jgi:hypothetical protein
MKLYNPDDIKANNFTVAALEAIELPSNQHISIAVGATRIGTKTFFFSTKSGREIENVEMQRSDDLCLGLVKASYSREFGLASLRCDGIYVDFLCETEDEIKA